MLIGCGVGVYDRLYAAPHPLVLHAQPAAHSPVVKTLPIGEAVHEWGDTLNNGWRYSDREKAYFRAEGVYRVSRIELSGLPSGHTVSVFETHWYGDRLVGQYPVQAPNPRLARRVELQGPRIPPRPPGGSVYLWLPDGYNYRFEAEGCQPLSLRMEHSRWYQREMRCSAVSPSPASPPNASSR